MADHPERVWIMRADENYPWVLDVDGAAAVEASHNGYEVRVYEPVREGTFTRASQQHGGAPREPFTPECRPGCVAEMDMASLNHQVYLVHADDCPHAPVRYGFSAEGVDD